MQIAMARHAEHLDRLILLDSPAPRFKDTDFLFGDIYPDIPQSEYSTESKSSVASRCAADGVYISMLFCSPDHRRQFLSRMATEKRVYEISERLFEEMVNLDLSLDVTKFHFPVLVANGRFDVNVAPATAFKIHQAIPGSEFVVFERSGHMPFFEEPDRFAEVVSNFVTEPGSKEAAT